MAIYLAGTSLADLTGYSGGLIATTSTGILSTVCREGIDATAAGRLGWIDFPSAYSDFWIKFHLGVSDNSGTNSTDYPIFELYSTGFSTSQPLFRLAKSGTNTGLRTPNSAAFQYWDGSAWQRIGPLFTGPLFSSPAAVAMRVKIATSGGEYSGYSGGLIGQLTGNTKFTSAASIDRMVFRCDNAVAQILASEWIVADINPTDYRVAALYPNANGANTAWLNTYTEVDETGIGDTDYISGATNGDAETYGFTDIPASLSGMDVAAVVMNLRARKGASGPQNVQRVARIGGTDYASGNLSGLGYSFGVVQNVMETNPATSAAWTQAAVNGAEFGVKAIT